jgi:hypothetical protein
MIPDTLQRSLQLDKPPTCTKLSVMFSAKN